MIKKDIIYPKIKLKYHKKGRNLRCKDLRCEACGSKNIILGSQFLDDKGKIKHVCEECSIYFYKQDHGFRTLRAAALRRRRMFDVAYLFEEMLMDKYVKVKNYNSHNDLSEEEINVFLNVSGELYNTLFTKEEKEKIEEIIDQKDIEKEISRRLESIEF